MSDFRKLKIRLGANGLGTVILDGVDISRAVTGLQIAAQANSLTRVRVDLLVDLEAELEVDVKGLDLQTSEPK